MPDYKTNDPRGWCGDPARGAALGRGDIHDAPADFAGKLTLRRIHIDQQGYDENGTYWGTGEPLYWYADEEGQIDACTRAKDRADAITKVHGRYPRAEIAPPDAIDPGFLAAYIECALWSSTDHTDESGGEPLDKNYSEEDIAPATLEEMKRECEDFQTSCAELLEQAYATPRYDAESAGHDFWLTRNGHGAGFWDRGLGDVGKLLTAACKPYGSVDLYVGDDGKIYS